jgi:osmotically-inducible protein OsmY
MWRDRDLQRAVMDELSWEPGVKASDIKVSVKDGVVTLTGFVDNYPAKLWAERAVKRLSGVKSVADEIKVRPPDSSERMDTDLARAAENVLDWNVYVPNNRIKLTVEDGWISLDGTVDWQFQKLAAEKAVSHLTGVKGITNRVALVPKTSAADVKSKIEMALERSAKVDAQGITVELRENKVILNGNVRSWAEREEAERAVWAAPGVLEVEDHIRIES